MRTIGLFLMALSWIVQPMAANPALGQDEKIEHPEAKAVAVTPDGKLWISANKDIRVWDVATGRLVKTIVPDEPPAQVMVLQLRVTGDSKTVFAMTQTAIEGYSIATGKLIFRVKGAFGSFDVSRDGKTVAVGGDGEVILYDTTTEKVIRKIKGDSTRRLAMEAAGNAIPNHPQPMGTVTLSPDGKWLAAVAILDWIVRVYDVKTGQQKHAFPTNNPSYCGHAVFSPDSALLAMSRFNGQDDQQGKEVISVWDLRSGKLQQEFVEGAFLGFGTSADWKWMASCGTGVFTRECTGEIHVWERATGKLRCTIAGPNQFGYSRFVFSSDGNTLVGCNHVSLQVWDLNTGKKLPFGHRNR